ncbi:MAG: LLM class flavin-dependent oxidoreductase [Actinobacteria bacterium]|nr:LLM class flavin-dependent oxidoreductase [Actinomycetota bacterium]
MEFGLMTEPQVGLTYADLLAAARLAEDLGLEVFGRADHLTFPRFSAPHATEAFTTLAGLARETRRIRLMVLVSPITFRHPAILAKAAATIDEMSGGRFVLGLGTGWMEEEHTAFGLPFPPWPERYARLEEALQYLRVALGKTPGTFAGTYYRLSAEAVRPLPCGPLPLVVGGTGARRTPRLAGLYADEYNATFLSAEDLLPRIAAVRRAAAEAGRPPGEPAVSIMAPAITGPDAASYQRNLAAVAAADPFGRSPEQIESRWRERGLPVGAAPEARRALEALAAMGVGRFYLQHLGPFDPEVLADTFGVLRG